MVSPSLPTMKADRAMKALTVASAPSTEQLVLNAYLASTRSPAFRAFAKRTLVPKRRKKAGSA